jgi:hypothetical protein
MICITVYDYDLFRSLSLVKNNNIHTTLLLFLLFWVNPAEYCHFWTKMEATSDSLRFFLFVTLTGLCEKLKHPKYYSLLPLVIEAVQILKMTVTFLFLKNFTKFSKKH